MPSAFSLTNRYTNVLFFSSLLAYVWQHDYGLSHVAFYPLLYL